MNRRPILQPYGMSLGKSIKKKMTSCAIFAVFSIDYLTDMRVYRKIGKRDWRAESSPDFRSLEQLSGRAVVGKELHLIIWRIT